MARTESVGDNSLPTFDLDTWASNYSGPLLPLRLAHIALNCRPIAKQALSLALHALTAGKDTEEFNRLYELAAELGISEASLPPRGWSIRQEEANRRESARLEGELRGYKNNLIRESIRMGQEDIAMHLLLTGGPIIDESNAKEPVAYGAAYQAFGRMRDYCTTPTHVNSMTLRLAYTALLQAVSRQQSNPDSTMTYWNTMFVHAGRLRSAGVKDEEQSLLTPIAAALSGIAHMGQRLYNEATTFFLTVPFTYHNLGSVHGIEIERAVASANDLAVYGGLCALATLSRDDLIDRVLGGPFRPFLEQEPHMRKAITLYTTAKYQQCLAVLQHYRTDWTLDVLLAPHVADLFTRIRERSITAYFSSFSQVSLVALAETFPPPASNGPDAVAAMEAEVLRMMEAGALNARIDLVDKILFAPARNARQATHAQAAATAAEIERTLRLRLHKANMIVAGLEISRSVRGS